jgi:hypothetical protein
MAKNIVICCDGTGNEFGESKSNVVKLYKMLVYDASQIAYYHPGVGTMGAQRLADKSLGYVTRTQPARGIDPAITPAPPVRGHRGHCPKMYAAPCCDEAPGAPTIAS